VEEGRVSVLPQSGRRIVSIAASEHVTFSRSSEELKMSGPVFQPLLAVTNSVVTNSHFGFHAWPHITPLRLCRLNGLVATIVFELKE